MNGADNLQSVNNAITAGTIVRHPQNSLRSRLTTLVIVAIFGAVTIVTAFSVRREIGQYGQGKTAELQSWATVFAANIADDVRNNDKAGALEALQAIAGVPTIEYVRVETPSGDLFVELGGVTAHDESDSASAANSGAALSVLAEGSSVASVPIADRGAAENAAPLGTLKVYADRSALAQRIITLIWDAVVAAVFAAGIGLLIALRMQRAVTRPIQNLTDVMNSVRTTGDFGRRAKRISEDEAGELVDSFNEMLDEIQERDAKLLAHQQNLKKIVRQKTKQFEDAKEIAEAANIAKSEFLATMSHEIRTPMNGMLVMAELLNSASLAPRQKRYADVIVKSGQSLLAIINDILDFSKIEAGRLDLEAIPVKPVDIIHDVVGLFWERASSADIDLAAYVGPDVPDTIKGDPVRLNQVLSNLVNNALKFTEAGSVVVAAKMVRSPGRKPHIEFSVTDTGVGIAKEKQRTIFEAFSQADQTTTRKFGGTGLGLAICYKIVEAMNGAINVASIEGKGSRFYFNFPVKVIKSPLSVEQATSDMRAIIAIPGAATAKTLSRYLHEAGISSQIVEQNTAIVSHMAYADIIFASPEFLDAFNKSVDGGPDQWVPARICVSELGDNAPDRLLESGIAEDLIIKPLSRLDVMEQINRILSGALRGREAVHGKYSEALKLPSFAGKRVLAADDSPVNREVVSAALARFEFETSVADDGRTAVEAVEEQAFDLILMDCSMPGMDGFAATRAIRQREEDLNLPRTTIIALTAHVAGSDEEWRIAGMDDYVTKPFTITSLADAICRHLTPNGVSESHAAAASSGKTQAPAGTLPAPAIKTFLKDSDNGAPFDQSALAGLADMAADSGADLILRALTLFEEHSKPALLRIAKAVQAGEAEEIKSAAHALKSMSVNVGALMLGETCGAIERAALEQGDYRALMKELKHRFQATHEALPQIKANYAQDAA